MISKNFTENRGIQLHALIIYKKEFCTTNPHYFDLHFNNSLFHATINPANQLKDYMEYIGKGCDLIVSDDLKSI
jgi:hypothetical protein